MKGSMILMFCSPKKSKNTPDINLAELPFEVVFLCLTRSR